MGNSMRSLKRPFVAQQEEEEEDEGQSSPPTKRARIISNPLKKYRVFISHRGPDVKHSVARHLFDLLDVRGIQTFLDVEEMEGGEGVSEQIEEAIASSKVQIVIFSKNFAESKWCLEEVRMMMEKRKEGTCTVIPVFYDVEPFEVRFMKGVFGEKLRKKHTKRETVGKIQEWRKALEEVSQISGFYFSQHEGKLVSEVVAEVCKNLQKGITYDPCDLLGREDLIIQTVKQVMERKKNYSGLTFVEITGIGGIGKTSFAHALYNQIRMHFKRFCFVEDVKGRMEKEGVGEILKILLKTLFYIDIQPIDIAQTKSLLKDLLKNEDVLIIFDNMNHKDKLADILVEDFELLAPSSVVVVTSRDANIFKKYVISDKLIQVPIPKLEYTESKMLFCKKAFRAADSKIEERFEDLVDKIVKKCDGVPLAVVLFGRHVFGKKISHWEFFWQNIQDSIPKDLKDVLQITYHSLETELEKQIFLDAAIFFHGDKAQILEDIWVEDPDQNIAGFKIAFKNLKRKLLVQITEDGEIFMHDVLRDMAKSIVDQENELEPAFRSRLWRPHEVIRVFSDEMSIEKTKGLRGLWIKEDTEKPFSWHTDAFVGMSSLKVLIVEGKCIYGDLSKLPRGLLYLRWRHYPYEDVHIPLWFVRIVDLSFGKQKMLWNYGAKEAPINLRQLILQGCSRIQKIPEWTGKIRLLREVDLSHCSSLQTIPESIGLLQGLERLDLSWCFELKTLPETFGNLLSLRELSLDGCWSLQTLPETFGFLRNLVILHMFGCMRLKILPSNFGHLRSLQKLKLISCWELKELPENFGRLEMLQNLSLYGCSSLKILPQTFGHLKRLKSLDLGECKMLILLPEDTDQLSNLGRLYLDGCCKLKELPENFGRLEMLEHLNLNNCSSLKNLPETFGHLKRLKSLEMERCKMLKLVRANTGHLENLEKLYVGVGEMKASLESCGQLERLRVSHSSEAELALQDFCKNLPCLRELHIQDLEIEQFPNSLSRLHRLERLSIDGCPKLQRVSNLPTHLHSVQITDCESLKVIDVRDLHSLDEFRVRGCRRLRDITGLINLDGISHLEIEECMSLTDIDIGSSFHTANNIVSESIASATGWWNALLIPDFHPFKNLCDMRITVNAELFFQDMDTTETTISEMSIVSDSRRRSNPKCLFFPLKQSTSLGKLGRRYWVVDGVLPRKLKCIGVTIFLVLHCVRASTVGFSIGHALRGFLERLNETRMTLLHTEIYSNICKDDLNKAFVCDYDGAVRGGWMCVHVIEEEFREDEEENVWGHFAKEIRRHVHTSLSSMTTASYYLPITIDVESHPASQKISPVAIMKHILSP